MDNEAAVTLKCTIASHTGYSGAYRPEHILEDKPGDQQSRWSGFFPSPLKEQSIVLRLDKPSILSGVKFGKYKTKHPCSVKDFRIFAGLTEDAMKEVLKGTLKDDPIPEEFAIRSTNSAGVRFPVRYVKIIPLSAAEPSYHMSIWHVALSGNTDENMVQETTTSYNKHMEDMTTRMILKSLRDRGLTTAYEALLAETQVKLEHDTVQKLYEAVKAGDFEASESAVLAAASDGLFMTYLESQPSKAEWTKMNGADPNGNIPCARGGHAMCIDDEQGKIYLHGGFDGHQSLDDFWVYHIIDDRWELILSNTSGFGLGPRSCHKMVFDSMARRIYLLGRLSDSDAADCARIASAGPDGVSPDLRRPPHVDEHAPELWSCSVDGPGAWEWLLAPNAVPNHAPPLLFDHQMVFIPEDHKIIVFGGRSIDNNQMKDSGWYIYVIREKSWIMLSADPSSGPSLRFCHSMVYDHKLRHIFIFGGQQKNNQYLSDVWIYDIDTSIATELCTNMTSCGGVETFSQRAVIDPTTSEIYLSCGIGRESSSTVIKPDSNWVYRYNPANMLKHGRWSKILPPLSVEDKDHEEPMPRCAHQTVYHTASQRVFLHGGNAGMPRGTNVSVESAEMRLNDMWSMKLRRPTPDYVVRRATYLIRTLQFQELCQVSSVEALRYLQTQVSAMVDHSDPIESASFQILMHDLITSGASIDDDDDEIVMEGRAGSPASEPWTAVKLKTSIPEERKALFQRLLRFFPAEAKEPSVNLSALIARSL